MLSWYKIITLHLKFLSCYILLPSNFWQMYGKTCKKYMYLSTLSIEWSWIWLCKYRYWILNRIFLYITWRSDGQKSVKRLKSKSYEKHGQKSSQNVQKEAKEGKTYETAVGLNLDTTHVHQPSPTEYPEIEHFLESIKQNEKQEYEKMVPPYSARPKPETLSFDSTKFYTCYFWHRNYLHW